MKYINKYFPKCFAPLFLKVRIIFAPLFLKVDLKVDLTHISTVSSVVTVFLGLDGSIWHTN